jgi:hypothetical protein
MPGCTCPALLRRLRAVGKEVAYVAITRFGAGFHTASAFPNEQLAVGRPPSQFLQPQVRKGCRLGTELVWADPGSLATTTGLVSLPRGT